MNILKTEHLSLWFGEKKVLDDFSCSVEEGEHLVIMGTSGAGKTSFLRIVSGLNREFTGKLECHAKKIAYQFQEPRLLPERTALENVALVIDEKQGIEKAKRILTEVGLEEAVDKLPAELSGGMQKRVALARTLAYGGDLYLFDEPFESLDQDTALDMLELIRKYTKDAAVILVTHSREFARLFGDRMIEVP